MSCCSYKQSTIFQPDSWIRQCIFSVFGGHVDVTGEILHGKTSPLRHDSKGIYAGLPQDLPVTRYHSLAGTHTTLPDALEVSSWIAQGPDGGKGIIMGVRHKTLLVEGVQFHPESILTAEGRSMLKSFLAMRGGTWEENATHQRQTMSKPATAHTNGVGKDSKGSILERIYSRRQELVEQQKTVSSQRPQDFQAYYDLGLAPPQIPFPERLYSSPFPLSLLAEIKRASPSKGPIAMHICAPAQARQYALVGASVISVLTEPDWFHGSIDDLRAVRQSLEGYTNRPAILRKEFIFDEYQILEARLAGADTILLIVKMLDDATLKKLFEYSRQLEMEPLVEVNTPEEMKKAIQLGAKVIGVNNRDLTSFEVDLDTTSRLMDAVSKDTIVCALSGISGPADVEAYKANGVRGILVGEALMRASDTHEFVTQLLGQPHSKPQTKKSGILVKICGTRSPEAAIAAIEAGANFVGIILVEGRTRCVSQRTALAISVVIHNQTSKASLVTESMEEQDESRPGDFFDHTTRLLRMSGRALLVGVFRNQPLSYVLSQQRLLNLDVVQLHGSEPLEWASLIPVPVIRRFGPKDSQLGKRGYHAIPLIDSAEGGTGKVSDIGPIESRLKADPGLRIMLAGGLHVENVQDILRSLQTYQSNVFAVDVSSGVETEGVQDLDKIRKFVMAAKDAFEVNEDDLTVSS